MMIYSLLIASIDYFYEACAIKLYLILLHPHIRLDRLRLTCLYFRRRSDSSGSDTDLFGRDISRRGANANKEESDKAAEMERQRLM